MYYLYLVKLKTDDLTKSYNVEYYIINAKLIDRVGLYNCRI